MRSSIYIQKQFSIAALAAVFIFAAVGCTSDSSVGAVESVADVAKSYSAESVESISQLERLIMEGEGAASDAVVLIDAAEPVQRWVAVYIIGRVGSTQDVDQLLPLLSDEVETVRVSAAGSLANKGYTEAIPVLIDAVDSTGTIEYLHPQREIADYSTEVLQYYTEQQFSTADEWRAWWEAQQENITWNTERKRYE